jgi:hypothetical protein
MDIYLGIIVHGKGGIEFYFKGCTDFSATVERCQRLQLAFLAQLYWAGHPMVY